MDGFQTSVECHFCKNSDHAIKVKGLEMEIDGTEVSLIKKIETKQNKTKQNKTKQNKTRQNSPNNIKFKNLNIKIYP